MLNKRAFATVALTVVLGLLSCVDGDSPTGIDAAGVARLAIIPTIAEGARSTASVAQPVNRIRVTARKSTDGAVLVVHEQDVDPNAAEWTLELEVPVPDDGARVVLTIELIHLEAGAETVEWSGRSSPFTLTAGQSTDAREVQVSRGPASNLGVTQVTVTPDSATVEEGDTLRLGASVTTSAQESPTVFWGSLDENASVNDAGLVTALLPGQARVVAEAGAHADTAVITVLAVPDGVVVSPDSVVTESRDTLITFTAVVIDARSDAIESEEVQWASRDTTRVESLGEGAFRAFGAGRAWIEARAVSDTALVDSALVVVVAPEADLAITKSADLTEIAPGDTLTYTITVVNQGPDASGAFRVADFAPEGLAPLDDAVTTGASVLDSLLWRVGGLAAEAQATWTVRFVVGAGVVNEPLLFNSAVIQEAETFDPDTDNNEAIHELSVIQGVELSVLKSVSDDNPFAGSQVTYTIVVENYGPRLATDVRIQDQADDGINAVVSSSATHGAFNAATRLWTLDSIPQDRTDTLTLVVAVAAGTSGQTLVNRAFSTGPTAALDLDTSNDTASVSVVPGQEQTDLHVLKTVDNDAPLEGDTVTFEIVVDNFGPETARAVQLQDLPDSALTHFAGLQVTAGAVDSVSRIWTLDSIPAGTADTMKLRIRIDSGSVANTLWNRVRVVGFTDTVDPDETNNADSIWVLPVQREVDLNVIKTVSETTPFEGDTVTFSIVVDNWGPDTATAVLLADSADVPGFKVHGLYVSQGVLDTLTGIWTVGSIAPGASDTVLVMATADSGMVGDTVWNRVRVASVAEVDTDTLNNADSVSIVSQQRTADLVLHKFVDNDNPFEGDTVTYLVELQNFGGHTARNVVIWDSLDTGLTLVKDSATVGLFSTPTGLWAVDSVAPGATDTLFLKVAVDSSTAYQTLANRAGVASLTNAVETDATNDTASVALMVNLKVADIDVSKIADQSSAFEGDQVKFTITVDNFGDYPAHDVPVIDTVTTGFSVDSVVVFTGSWNAGTRMWTIPTLAVGSPEIMLVFATVDSGTVADTLWNHVIIGGLSTEVDTISSNNLDSASVFIGQREADLALHKFVDPSDPFEGDTVTFLVELQNFGNDVARNVQVFDSLDAGLTQVAHSSTRGAFDPPSRTWTVDSIAPGETDTLTLKVAVDSGTVADTLWNRAGAFALTNAVETDVTNDTASVSVVVDEKQADLNLQKTSDHASAQVGDTVTYELVLENWGSHPATGVAVLDTLPANVSLDASNATLGSYAAVTHTWTVGTVPVGDSDTLWLKVIVTSGNLGDTLRNVARIAPLTAEVDPDLGNNADSVGAPIEVRDIAVEKSIANASPSEGENFTYTIVVRNVGNLDVSSIDVRDTVPVGITYITYSSSHGSYTSGSGLWNLGGATLSPGDTAWLTITAEPAPGTIGQTLTNTARLVTPLDDNPSNDTSSVDLTVGNADLFEMAKSVSNATPSEGEDFTYTVVFRNIGPSELTDVNVHDSIPNGIDYISYSSSRGSYNSSSGFWDMGATPLNPGDTAWLTLTVEPAPGTIGDTIWNRAWGDPDQTDAQTANNMDSVAVVVGNADLFEMAKSVSNATPSEGEDFTYTVVFRNIGPSELTDVNVHDSIPNGIDYISYSSSRGSYNSGSGFWDMGATPLNPGDTAWLTLTVEPAPGTIGDTIWNRAWGDPDQTDAQTANNMDSVAVVVGNADLFEMAKSVSNATPSEGEDFTYTVVFRNIGPSELTDVNVHDSIPNGIDYISYSSSRGSYNSSSGFWDMGATPLNPGDTAWLTLTVEPAPGTIGDTIWNRAWGDPDQTDAQTANNMDSVAVVVGNADLFEMAKSVSNATPSEGEDFTYTVVFRNIGPSELTDVNVHDSIPNGIDYISYSSSRGSYNSSSGFWDMGATPLNPGDTAWLTLTVEPAPGTIGDTIWNRAWGDPDQTDAQTANNMDSVSVTVPGANLAVTKSVSDATPLPGDTVTYEVVITNVGPFQVTGVEVYDTLPGGLDSIPGSTYVSEGSWNPAQGLWSGITLDSAEVDTLRLKAELTSVTIGNDYDNRAWSSSDFTDIDPVNDTATARVTASSVPVNISLNKTVDDTSPNVGDTVTFTITWSNYSGGDLTRAFLYDSIPAGLTYLSHTTAQGSYDEATGAWDMGNPPESTTVTLSIDASVDSASAGDLIHNIVWAQNRSGWTGGAMPDSAFAYVDVEFSDYSVTKTVNKNTPLEGDSVLFTIQVTEETSDFAGDSVYVFDLLPSGFTYVAHTVTQGSYVPGTGIWNVGDVPSSGTETLQVLALVTAGTHGDTIKNVAYLLSAWPWDSNAADNRDSVFVAPKGTDLSLTKQANVADSANWYYDPLPDSLIYTLTVSNTGNAPVTNVVVHDTLPAETDSVANMTAGSGNATETGGVITWTIDTIPAYGNVTLNIEAHFGTLIDPDTLINVARIISSDQTDTLATNDRATHTVIANFGGAQQQQDAQDFAFLESGDRALNLTPPPAPPGDPPRRSRRRAGPL